MVYSIVKYTLGPLVKLWTRKVNGLNNLPKDKGFIIACNHGSYFDDIALPCTVIPKINKYIHIYVNSYFFKIFFFRIFLNYGRCIPVDVGKGKPTRTNKKAFKDAINYLKIGEYVGIFPEGHRSYPDRMRPGKTGVAKLALTAKVPVIPVGIDGSKKILPLGAFWPRLKRCTINIGKPMYFDGYYGKENNKKVLRLITNKIMKRIAKLAKDKYDY
ncbi:1-acyl-sn-glycerol-3-phosphate acyltransferase [Candidatus Woesearchaeota archaeon]|nr:1-acyl-sn-glycerol-3-phosphate acyltransferase [Candidatus Woesearchaeota archaeon]